MQFDHRTEALQTYRRELFESMLWPLEKRKQKTREIRQWVNSMPRSDYTEALKELYLGLLIYRSLNGRGSTWLYSVNTMCLMRMALAESQAEYEALVQQWWENARSKEKRTRKTKSIGDLSEEQVADLQGRIISRLFGEEMETLFAMTGDIEGMPFEGDQRERYDTKYKAEYDKMRIRYSGGDALTFPFWCREHLVTLQDLSVEYTSEWIYQHKDLPNVLYPPSEPESQLSVREVDYASPNKYREYTYTSRISRRRRR